MRWSTRSTRIALSAYVLLSVLILGGVTWGTLATLRLERGVADIRQANAFRDSVSNALNRMDNVLTPVVAREAARAFRDYIAYSHPSVAWRADGTELISEYLLEPSPLINQRLEPWILLHFQVNPITGEWQSPQAPSDWWLPRDSTIPRAEPREAARCAALLAGLAEGHSYESLAARVTAAQELAEQFERWSIGGHQDPDDPVRCISGICEKRYHRDFGWRVANQARMQTASLPQEACEPRGVVLADLWNMQPIEVDDDLAEVGVSVSAMTPVWLNPKDDGTEQLAFIRSAYVDGTELFQGFLVDWERLKEDLLARVQDDFGEMELDLVPIASANPGDVHRLMGAVPAAATVVRPVAGPSPWTKTHLLLGLVWLLALAILGSVGFGIQGLLALTERRTQFAYAITHELRTPLTTLRLYTDMLVDGLVPEGERDQYLRTLNTEAERLADLVNNVLEYARVERHAVQLDVKAVSVSELLESIREHCAARCERAGKKLVVQVDGLADTTIRTDPALVRQVVANLIDNACKHSADAADPTLTLRALSPRPDAICLDVEDHGKGIRPADKQLIFKPFRRGRNGNGQSNSGIGLGLALARNWARLLGGRLEAVPIQDGGEGSCFRLTIPLSRRS